MPLLYGEGSKAFMRLQLEIIRKSADESIFVWRREDLLSTNITKTLPLKSWERAQVQTYFQQNEARKARERADYKPGTFSPHSGLLAQQAADFLGSGHIRWDQRRKFVKRLPCCMTNQGLQFYVPAFPSHLRWLSKGDTLDVELNCYEVTTYKMKDESQVKKDKPIVLSLWKDGYGDDQSWRRYDCPELSRTATGEIRARRRYGADRVLHSAERTMISRSCASEELD